VGFIPEELPKRMFPVPSPVRWFASGLSQRWTLLLGGAAVCLIGAALLAHYRFVRARRRQARPAGVVWQSRAPASMAAPASRPVDLVARPLAGSGVEPLTELPPDMPTPPGAVLGYAFRRAYPDGVSDNLVCTVAADLAAVESFYRTALAQAGCKLAKRGTSMRGDGVLLVFLRGSKDSYSVNLRPTDKGKKVRISVVVQRLENLHPK
jgi:hypothetical protein